MTLSEMTAIGRKLLRGNDSDARGHSAYLHGDYERWVEKVAEWLDEISPESGLSAEWSALGQSVLVVNNGYDSSDEAWVLFQKMMMGRLHWLSKVPSRVERQRDRNSEESAEKRAPTNEVFLVHGHDEAARETVARFMEQLGLRVIVLHEQPNKGRTIIEKFLDYSDVSFAVVLLTADDRGGSCDASYESQRMRARQNVLLELGFFLGRLGRQNVCALHEAGVEIPSDYHGVVFIPFDKQNGWRHGLIKELVEAKLPVDVNKAFKK